MLDKDELKRLRSEEILSVEVITNPGADYDATVPAVVRIKTIRRQGEGFGFDFIADNSQELTRGFTDPSSTLNLQINEQHSLGARLESYNQFKTYDDMTVESENNLIGQDYSHQDSHSHYPYHWRGNTYYNGQVGKLNIDRFIPRHLLSAIRLPTPLHRPWPLPLSRCIPRRAFLPVPQW